MIGYFVEAVHVEDKGLFTWVTREELAEQYSIPTAYKAYIDAL